MKFIALILVFSLSSCDPKPADERSPNAVQFDLDCVPDQPSNIVGGKIVNLNDSDSKKVVLLLVRRNNVVTSCTGVPISDRIILTAAHCINTADPNNIQVIFHTDMNCSSGYTRENLISSKSYILHPDFDGSLNSKADIALILLSERIPANYQISQLYTEGENLTSDEVLMIGYGITDELSKDSLVLRKTKKSFKNNSYLKRPLIVFSQDDVNGGFCRGDSGAPSFVQTSGLQKIIGINSVNIGKDAFTECHTASASMYIPDFSDWVKSAANQF